MSVVDHLKQHLRVKTATTLGPSFSWASNSLAIRNRSAGSGPNMHGSVENSPARLGSFGCARSSIDCFSHSVRLRSEERMVARVWALVPNPDLGLMVLLVAVLECFPDDVELRLQIGYL